MGPHCLPIMEILATLKDKKVSAQTTHLRG